MTDLTASQAQPSAELACPLRQTILVDADQRCRVVRHDGHPHVYGRTAMTFVGDAGGSTAQQAGNAAFDHGSAVSTRVGEVHLTRGPCSKQAPHTQEPQDVLRCGRRGEGLDRARDPHGENPLLVQPLTQGRVMERQIAGQRVDGRSGVRREPRNRLLHLVDQGLPIAAITGIPHRQMQANDEASRWLGDNSGLAAKWRGAVALPFAHGRTGGIVGVDDLAVEQRLALCELAGLVFDALVDGEGGHELGVQAFPLVLTQLRSTVQIGVGGLRQGPDLSAYFQPLSLRLADQRHQHVAHPPALTAEAAHHLLELVLQLLRLRLQGCALGGALSRYRDDELEDFFGALYRVVASLTRWLPGSVGKVSTTKCAGRTRPSSIAVAAWIASRSSINGSSRRLRKWASTSGSTKCSWEPSTWTSLIPQAYITARSVRNRLQLCSSEQANACFRSSNAKNTRVETGGRPRVVGLGKRWTNERSTAATEGRPRKCLGPLAEGVRFRDEVRDLQAWSTSRQPMLEEAQDLHRRLSSEVGQGRPSIRRCDQRHNPLLGGIN